MSLKNLDDLEPGSPEWEAAVDAAQAEEDAARDGPETPDDGAAEGEGDTPDADAAPTTTGEQQPAPEKQNAPAGVLSKDGKKVLPFAVVQAARHDRAAERQARLAAEARAEALEKQLEALKSGKPLESEDDDPLDAAVAAAAEDVPIVAELHKALKATQAELKAMRGKSEPDPEQEPQGNPLQDAIDSVPALAEWQATDAEKFQRAQAIDMALKDSPKWRGKPLAERFAHVARQVADEFDIEIDEDEPQPNPTPNKADPREVVKRATRTNPNTLSDFKNGAPDTTPNRLDKLPPPSALRRMEQMTDAEIDAHLAKFG